jgi:transcriptional regulator with XRE-family HTH domain
MRIGGRLRELHIAEDLSQGDIEKRTGLPRAYTSRVENGHASPSIASLEKYATALDVPLYGLFYDRRRGCEFNLKPENKKTKWARPSTNGANMTCSSERLPSWARAVFMFLAGKLASRARWSRNDHPAYRDVPQLGRSE